MEQFLELTDSNSPRDNYICIFNRILENSIKVNCLCKILKNSKLDDSYKKLSKETTNFIEDQFLNDVNFVCDLSCFENLKYIFSKLKDSLNPKTNSFEENLDNLSKTWLSFEFLDKYPNICDYYGTTLFHYAASSDNHIFLLKFLLDKFSNGIYSVVRFIFKFKFEFN